MSILFYILLLLIAFLYASVGHGGATGYIALMTIFNYPLQDIKHLALLLNILVAGSAFAFNVSKTGLRLSLITPLLITSIPAAYFGSILPISNHVFHYLLAIVLLMPVYFLWLPPKSTDEPIQKASIPLLALIGLLLGFVSGMLGIGGGVFLSPILILCRWSTTRETSTISALFIVLNSVSGLLAVLPALHIPHNTLPIVVLVTLGGLLGSFLGSKYLPVPFLKKMIALVLIIAIIKLFITA